ncbi:MAG: hypothetical protein GEU96_11190 [Propionibacteriales bacterium]|nr:hypothetical protein [Propionibacteriales bacterium]
MPTTPESEAADLRRRARGSKVAGRLLNQPLRHLGVGAAVVVLGVTAVFGGLEPADTTPSRVAVEVGKISTVPPYDITIEKVLWVDELPEVYKTDDRNRWLAVTATIRNTHDESLYDAVELRHAVSLVGVDGLVGDPVRGAKRVESTYRKLLADSSDLSPVQPGIEYEMVYLFEQDGSVDPPDEVAVQLVGHTWRRDSIDQDFKWLDPTVIAESTLPVRPAEDEA